MGLQIVKSLLPRGFLLFLALLFLASCGAQKPIVHKLDEREANDILVYLAKRGIEAQKVQNTDAAAGGGGGPVYWDIVVAPERSVEAMGALTEGGFPKRAGQNLLNIFQKSGLVPSEMEEKIRYQAGLAEQIASTIRKIDGVLDADVQLSIPEEDPLNPLQKKEAVSASVYVKHTGILDDPNSQLIPKIKRFVASSVQGLSYDNVTVIPDRARFSESPFSTSGTSSSIDEQNYVSVWGIIVAKSSVFYFQLLFFTFSILMLLFLLAICWFIWKFFHILTKLYHRKELLSPHPLHTEHLKDLLADKPVEKKEEKATIPEDEKIEPPKPPEDSGTTT